MVNRLGGFPFWCTMALQILEVDWPQYPYYRSCDQCEYCATDDIDKGGNWLELRQWFQEIVDGAPGVTLCSECIESFLAEPISPHGDPTCLPTNPL